MGDCRSHSVLRQLKAACREVGIERNVVAHSLRHSFCTIMLRKFNPYVVKTLAGHSSITTTMRYGHEIGDDVERAVSETTFEM
jgi:integrase/recombinase XerD